MRTFATAILCAVVVAAASTAYFAQSSSGATAKAQAAAADHTPSEIVQMEFEVMRPFMVESALKGDRDGVTVTFKQPVAENAPPLSMTVSGSSPIVPADWTYDTSDLSGVLLAEDVSPLDKD